MAYYFVSDVHLGSQAMTEPRAVEKMFVEWLDRVADDARAIFLVGDIFDFWFEYKHVVPKGFVRVLGKLAQLADRGIEIHFFTGNHDIWTFGYLESECGMKVHTTGEIFSLFGKQVYVGHGNELRKCQTRSYRLMNDFFHCRIAQRLFAWLLHPDWALWFGLNWSRHNRVKRKEEVRFRGECDPIVQSVLDINREKKLDYCILGHFHSMIDFQSQEGPRIVVMGDWINNPSYCVLDEQSLELKKI